MVFIIPHDKGKSNPLEHFYWRWWIPLQYWLQQEPCGWIVGARPQSRERRGLVLCTDNPESSSLIASSRENAGGND